MSNEPANAAKKRMRSPAYPATDLKEAIERAEVVWKKDRNHETQLKSLSSHWGFNPASSSVLGRVASLKHFGLMDEVKGGTPGAVKLSDLAVKILANEDLESPDRIALVKTAALTPSIYAELWTKYQGDLPSDVTIKTYLVGERMFNPDVVNVLLKDFRSTISFAKLSNQDKVTVEPHEQEALEAKKPLLQQQHVIENLRKGTAPGTLLGDFLNPPPPVVVREFNFPLPTGVASIKVPFPLTEDDFENLLKALSNMKYGLVKKPDPIPIECTEGWENKAKDLAELGVEFNLVGFDYSSNIVEVKKFTVENNLDLRLDLNKGIALFRKRPEKTNPN